MYTIKRGTQQARIIEYMLKAPRRWHLASAFCGADREAPYIGYKAPTRLSEMQLDLILISRWSEHTTETGRALKEYKLLGYYKIKVKEGHIEISRK